MLLQDPLCESEQRRCGWIDYFLKVNGFNNDIFMEIPHTFLNGEAMVKGLKVISKKEWIA